MHDEEQHRALGGGVRFALLRAWLLHRAASIRSLELRCGSRQEEVSTGINVQAMVDGPRVLPPVPPIAPHGENLINESPYILV